MITDEITKIDVQSIEALPTLPVYFNQIMATVEDERADADDLACIVERDAALSSKLLKLANSAYYGRSREVASIRDVIVTVGFEEIRSISLGCAVFESCAARVPVSYLEELWNHSLKSALASGVVCRAALAGDRSRVYLGTLLHDIGKLAFIYLQGNLYLEKLVEQHSGHPVTTQEEIAFGVDHASLGRWLAERWKFPPDLVEMIGNHHVPEAGNLQYPGLVAAVYLSDLITNADCIENLELDQPCSTRAALSILNIGYEELLPLAEKVTQMAVGKGLEARQ